MAHGCSLSQVLEQALSLLDARQRSPQACLQKLLLQTVSQMEECESTDVCSLFPRLSDLDRAEFLVEMQRAGHSLSVLSETLDLSARRLYHLRRLASLDDEAKAVVRRYGLSEWKLRPLLKDLPPGYRPSQLLALFAHYRPSSQVLKQWLAQLYLPTPQDPEASLKALLRPETRSNRTSRVG